MMEGIMEQNDRRYYGNYGGQYVSESLMPALEELEEAFEEAMQDEMFLKEVDYYMKQYVGRETPLFYAQHLSEAYGAKIYLKREDLNHTGAHKINNVIGQILLAKRMGKKKVIAETGAGQHGVATATGAALFGMECTVYMGAEDMERQKLNVLRMELLGAKVDGAWMTEFRTETKDDNAKRELPLISIVCNFSKPVGDEPVLLTPDEVETFLHEFGHALHGLSAQATYGSLSGTNVYHDFVELFSQFNENYLTEKDFLDGFARHYKTGKKMPKELIEKFVKAGQYGAGYSCMRQLGFGYLDMAYHTLREPLRASADVEKFEQKAQDPVRIFDVVEGCITSPSFGHIFSGGYAAGYYGYKWAEALDADAFAAFKENGIFNASIAAKFKKMLQAGGTVDPMALYKEFRGKEPTVDALLQRDGVK